LHIRFKVIVGLVGLRTISVYRVDSTNLSIAYLALYLYHYSALGAVPLNFHLHFRANDK